MHRQEILFDCNENINSKDLNLSCSVRRTNIF